MADPKARVTQGPLIIRAESGKLFAPDSIASLIENFVETEEGTLRSLSGPTYVLPQNLGPTASSLTFFSYIFGIFHGTLMNGQRDILLVHGVDFPATTNGLFILAGWDRAWEQIYEFPGASISQVDVPSFRTQFELTSNGIVIVPGGGGQVHFLDEDGFVAPLGYSDTPGAPEIEGPVKSKSFFYAPSFAGAGGADYIARVRPPNTGNNNNYPSGYTHDGNIWSEWRNTWTESTPGVQLAITPAGTGMHTGFGRCRLGTIQSSSAVDAPSWLSPNPLGYEENGTPWLLDPATIAAAKRQDKTSSAAALAAGIPPSQLLECAYEGAMQWVDRYGNLSPISRRSDVVVFDAQTTAFPRDAEKGFYTPTAGDVQSPGTNDYYSNVVTNKFNNNSACPPDKMQKQVLWKDISVHETSTEGLPAPECRTVGRLLLRTRDLYNSGTTELFVLPSNAQGGVFGFATIPDNIATIYPDNIPDAWLNTRSVEVDPMPAFRLCKLALGRMWYANSVGDPGVVRWTLPGRFGTLGKGDFVYPDPRGGEITGLWAVPAGILFFTESSTFLATDTSAETGLSYQTLSTTVGCVSPDSIATMINGTTVWLGQDGFYAYQDGVVSYFSEQIRRELRLINKARQLQACAAVDYVTGEYRCWVPMESSVPNNVCYIYDAKGAATGWRRRTDVKVTCVTVTKDHRAYMIVGGSQESQASLSNARYIPFVLDHAHSRPALAGLDVVNWAFETTWLLNENDFEKQTAVTVYFWLRETTSSTFDIIVYRDWRKEDIETQTVSTYPVSDAPPFWGTSTLGSGDTLRNRRPYWSRAEIYVPSCEVFKIRASVKDGSPIEFVGLSFDFIPHPSGGARVQP